MANQNGRSFIIIIFVTEFIENFLLYFFLCSIFRLNHLTILLGIGQLNIENNAFGGICNVHRKTMTAFVAFTILNRPIRIKGEPYDIDPDCVSHDHYLTEFKSTILMKLRTAIDESITNDPDCIKGRKKTVQVSCVSQSS